MRSKAKTAKREEEKGLRRGLPVVEGILAATLEELALAGYRALRVEDVARRAGVNKTTVYRRWPEKRDLVHAALHTMAQSKFAATEDLGSLREDLISKGKSFAEFATSSHGRSLIRMMFIEGTDSELRDIIKTVRESHANAPHDVVMRAIERGELSSLSEARLLLESFVGAIHHRIFLIGDAVSEQDIAALVDLLLHGALHRRSVGSTGTRAKISTALSSSPRRSTKKSSKG